MISVILHTAFADQLDKYLSTKNELTIGFSMYDEKSSALSSRIFKSWGYRSLAFILNRKAHRVDSAQFKEALNTRICLHNLLSDWKCQRADG